jgi:serine/threonine-protein kinase RsbW
MAASNNKKLVLDSSFEEMEQIQPFVKELQQWAHFGEEDFNRIMLALSEAVNNAIVHGNKENPNKNVYVNTSLKDRTLTVNIQDEGKGFNPDTISDPLKEENLLNEGGRGIYLIKQYADDVQFSKGGTKVAVTFHLTD